MFPAFTLASARSEGPRQEAVHNDLVRTVVVPGAGHCARRDQPSSPAGLSTRSSPRLRGQGRPGTRRHPTKKALLLKVVSTVQV
jgi:hypothetical protein